ncbi:GspH/FimT family pseudopilin [Bradyrhizobium sp. Tv2a-2]|uniref:GspH/FimT family pseudopilin n=1 Tax=Bradyrhizobium sp. Tv2a-2 TaxID=113395 RepID=UPI000464A88A|nr:GspH/FimT family pseudopilin [Bradyrhizobium sp. Tv2a-2]
MKRCLRSSSGFTLLELLVVLGIIAVVLATMMMARPNVSGTQLNTTARSVAGILRLARAHAIERNAETLVVVDPVVAAIGLPGAMRSLPRGISIDVTAAASETAGGRAGLRFYPDGQSSGGTILLRRDGRAARVEVNWLTGEARVEP